MAVGSGLYRVASRVAWVVSLVAYVSSVALAMANRQSGDADAELVAVALQNLSFVAVATLAVLILKRQPKNTVAWAVMLVGVTFPLEAFFAELTEYALAAWGQVGITLFAGWVSRWIWIGSTLAIPLILFYYPDGRLPSGRWRPVMHLIWSIVAITWSFSAFDPTPMQEFGDLPNPLGLQALDSDLNLIAGIAGTAFWAMAIFPVLGAISLVPRYRRSKGIERQQMKLIAWVGAVGVLYLLVLRSVVDINPIADALSNTFFTVFVGGSLTAGIVRYRVFEIDRIISRSISYTTVVVLLGAVFAAGVVGIPNAFGIDDSPFLVAASTLAVAGLFNPLRVQVQRKVDRRFNRSRYEAHQVTEEFTARLRHSPSAAQLANVWIETVDQHFEPASSGVWLNLERPTTPSR